jgi:hypothetical protein
MIRMKIIDGDAREVRNFERERAERFARLAAARARGDIEAVKRIEAEILAEPNDIPRPAVTGGVLRG